MTAASPNPAPQAAVLAPVVRLDPAAAHLAAKYGENYRELLGIVDHPYAETECDTWLTAMEPFDAAPDLTAWNRGGGL